MELTDWIVILAITLIAIAFFCGRAPARWSLENHPRRFTGHPLGSCRLRSHCGLHC
jgi:hypothetical protein